MVSVLLYVALVGLVPVAIAVLFAAAGIIRYIPNDRVGIVERLWSRHGSVTGGFIALEKEAGYQPDLLRGGFHFFAPFQYRLHKMRLVTIAQGKIGYVYARDGLPLEAGQTLASNNKAETCDFENVSVWLNAGGQKGPQRKVMREGIYAVNLAQFVVLTEDSVHALHLDDTEEAMLQSMHHEITTRDGFNPVRIRDKEDKIGVVTVHDGPILAAGEIIAPLVDADYQEPEKFLSAGGHRGRQSRPLVEGTYYLNRLFATVELIDKTTIDIGFAGVVVSYTGKPGSDVSGASYRHGELVDTGERGVWEKPMMPGKYPFNTFAGRIIAVPTTNFVLKWQQGAAGQHRLDENLAEISLITKDAFEPILPLSVVVHIDYQRAPQVVQRFGDVRRLVEQTLDPMVSAYFKDIGQTRTLIELLQQRGQIQSEATQAMKDKFAQYSLELLEVLIGTPRAPEGDPTIETILTQLRQRQIAREQVETYELQGHAANQERALNESKATAAMQTQVTQSSIEITVAENSGSAKLARAKKDAETVRVSASAEADKRKLEGEGEASAIEAIGAANAHATLAQVEAYGGAQYRLAEQIAIHMFEAVAQGHQPLVPHILVGGGGDDNHQNGAGGLVSGLVASLLPAATKLAEVSSAPHATNGDARK